MNANRSVLIECLPGPFVQAPAWRVRFLDPSLPGACTIAVVAAPSQNSARQAHELCQHLSRFLRDLAPEATEEQPAHSRFDDPPSLEPDDSTARRVVVVVSDGTTPIPNSPLLSEWPGVVGPPHAVIPVIPLTGQPNVSALLDNSVSAINASFWSSSIEECIDPIITHAGLTAEEKRIFISYRRPETLELAEQLFERLVKSRFDVFVDRFSVRPGVDFQEQLTDELAHKSMVLVLESPSILNSQWIEHELTFAKTHELGRLSLHLPGGKKVPWLTDDHRMAIGEADLIADGTQPLSSGRPVCGSDRLTPAALERVVGRVIAEHTIALHRRRWALITSIEAALGIQGVTDVALAADGHLMVRSPAPHASNRYALWAMTRPPEVDQFWLAHDVGQQGALAGNGFVAVTSFSATRRSERQAWLAQRSSVQLLDLGKLDQLAATIRSGGAL